MLSLTTTSLSYASSGVRPLAARAAAPAMNTIGEITFESKPWDEDSTEISSKA